MEPVNYQFADPAAAMLNGLKYQTGINQIQEHRADRERAFAVQQQQALAQQQQQQALSALASNPNATHADYAKAMILYPALAENLGKSFAVLEKGQQTNAINFGTRVYSAQLAGKNDLAAQLLEQRAKAEPEQAQHYTTLAQTVREAPAAAKTISALTLAAALGPEKFAESFAKIGGEQRAQDKAPAELKKAEADAVKAVNDADAAGSDAVIKAEQAKVAPQTVLLDLQKKGWDIKKIEADIDIARQANRIAAMNAATSREGNDLKRQELKLKVAEAQEKLDGKVREKAAAAEAGATNIDNMLNTVQRILKNPSLNDVLGSLEGRMPAAASALDDEESDAIALIETLGSQAFLAQIPNIKGMGALSNAEGEKLQSALQNLSRSQSEKQFRASLNEASRLLMKGRENLSRSTGVPLGKPDTPAAPGARPPLSAFEKK